MPSPPVRGVGLRCELRWFGISSDAQPAGSADQTARREPGDQERGQTGRHENHDRLHNSRIIMTSGTLPASSPMYILLVPNHS
jgi:hypothetical protein